MVIACTLRVGVAPVSRECWVGGEGWEAPCPPSGGSSLAGEPVGYNSSDKKQKCVWGGIKWHITNKLWRKKWYGKQKKNYSLIFIIYFVCT